MVGAAADADDGGEVVFCATTDAANISIAVETAERFDKVMVEER